MIFLANSPVELALGETVLTLHEWVNDFFWKNSSPEGYKAELTDLMIFLVVVVIAIIAYFIAKKVIFGLAKKLVSHTKNSWDDELIKSRVFVWLALLVPVIIIWKAGSEAFSHEQYQALIGVFGEVSVVLLTFLTINSVLNVSERIYRRYEVSKKFPVKGFIQVLKIVLFICGVIFIVSAIIGKSPLTLFAGLGAMSAVLMFIFKDSILGLVAGVQLSANRMVARGDWIEAPKFGADGEVLEVALTTVKVRNWDKTITTLPTYALISDSFKNWRGMSISGVRRIKRSLNIDMQSIKFVDEAMKIRLKKFNLLADYFEGKEEELTNWHTEQSVEPSDEANARILTNVGTFRAYIVAYLKNHKSISQDQTLLVRQLQPSQYGLPIEIYIFSKDNRWVEFEGIQSDIFDHLLAVMDKFDLKVFQRPSGADFAHLDSDRV